VVLHEIPQEIGDFGILVHGGLSVKKALLFNFLSGLTSILGALVILFLGQGFETLKLLLVPVTAGGFIYMAGSDLIPELNHEGRPLKSLLQMFFIALGVLVMALLAVRE